MYHKFREIGRLFLKNSLKKFTKPLKYAITVCENYIFEKKIHPHFNGCLTDGDCNSGKEVDRYFRDRILAEE